MTGTGPCSKLITARYDKALCPVHRFDIRNSQMRIGITPPQFTYKPGFFYRAWLILADNPHNLGFIDAFVTMQLPPGILELHDAGSLKTEL